MVNSAITGDDERMRETRVPGRWYGPQDIAEWTWTTRITLGCDEIVV